VVIVRARPDMTGVDRLEFTGIVNSTRLLDRGLCANNHRVCIPLPRRVYARPWQGSGLSWLDGLGAGASSGWWSPRAATLRGGWDDRRWPGNLRRFGNRDNTVL